MEHFHGQLAFLVYSTLDALFLYKAICSDLLGGTSSRVHVDLLVEE